MNIHEYQAKELMQKFGVATPPGAVASTPEEAEAVARSLNTSHLVIKAQIHAGGRGKGTFKSGFQGGVKLCRSAADVFDKAVAMLGNVLVTKQTGPEGRLVSKLLVAGAPNIKKELYCAVLLDRAAARPILMASTEGGVDIEQVADEHPEKIIRELIDPALGLMPFQGRKQSRQVSICTDGLAETGGCG